MIVWRGTSSSGFGDGLDKLVKNISGAIIVAQSVM